MSPAQGQILLGGRKRKSGKSSRVFLLLVAGIAAGAAVPHILAARLPRPGRAPAEAIFVLTGGDGRIEQGYRAWREGKARDLYIIGAGADVRLAQILPGRNLPPPEAPDRVHVEGWSTNTLENAFSVKSVVRDRRIRSAILLTSDYHLPRAWLALRKVLPGDVSITVMTVPSDWRSYKALPGTLRRHFLEGWKYWGYRILLRWE